ncbi:MAG: glutathione S-transferase N-terminal domain-containing protein [Geminicoccaceae bacterium]|nr:glutathione S-transferase N-terminal domain-containing protein [Geminicoccaceae bacterium]
MARRLYDLTGADPRCRFSPYCNRIRRALAAKGLDAEIVPIRFTDKDRIAFSGQKLVPILTDGERTITDSWDIACYLDEVYPEPPLMEGEQARALTGAFRNWVDSVIHPLILRIVILDIHRALTPGDQVYFRETREQRFGCTLEEFHQGEAAIPALQRALEPARMTLRQSPCICGDRPGFADFILAGAFDWAGAVSKVSLLSGDDPLRSWYARMGA